ncbi:MAG TPA: class A beta-lactamase [Thermoanaerobaculia bacterium]|jgi:beta-lactamase class A
MLTLILAAALALPPQKSDAVIGVSAIHLESGRRLAIRDTERFPMGSVYKFPIALTVLRRADSGTLQLDREIMIEPKDFAPGWSPLRDKAAGRPIVLSVRELLRQMVSISDNTASDALLRLVGGSISVTRRMAELGFGGIRIDRSEAEMARDLTKPGGVERYAIDVRDTASPQAMAELLVAFWQRRDGLSKESHDLLVDWMSHSQTGSRRIKAAVRRATVTHKTGTMPGTVNDVGIITSPDGKHHIAIAVFTKASRRDKTAEAEDDIAAIVAKVYAELTR